MVDRVTRGEIGAVVYLRDASALPAHSPEIAAVLEACDRQGVPLATNLATAEAVVAWMQQAQHRCR
jgi:methylglyoxal synthase